jgi:hypothetical protein
VDHRLFDDGALGARVKHAAIFMGPKMFRVAIAKTPFELGWIPLPTSYVAFEPVGEESKGRTHFDELPRIRRALVLVVPWLVILAICTAILGPELALGSSARGLYQFFTGGISPTGEGRALARRLIELVASEPWYAAGARIATKIVAFNFIPLPGLVGLKLPFELVRGGAMKEIPAWLTAIGMLVISALVVSWIVALALA